MTSLRSCRQARQLQWSLLSFKLFVRCCRPMNFCTSSRLTSLRRSTQFDTVRHETLMNKMATLDLPDNILNWIREFFSDRYHCTRYAGKCSLVAEIKASVIQGSGLGPAKYSSFGPASLYRHSGRPPSTYHRQLHLQIR